jgi:hypothetical protein
LLWETFDKMGDKCFDKRQMQIYVVGIKYGHYTPLKNHIRKSGKKKTHEPSCNNAKGVPSSLGRPKLQTPNFPSIIVICLQFYWLVLPKERDTTQDEWCSFCIWSHILRNVHKVNDVVFSFGPTIWEMFTKWVLLRIVSSFYYSYYKSLWNISYFNPFCWFELWINIGVGINFWTYQLSLV